MIKDVISDSYKGEYSIEVTFEDGAIGIVLSLSQNNSDVKKISQEVG